MPKTKVAPRVETRLHPDDYKYFERLCRDQGKTKGELAREAIRTFLEHHKNAEVQKQESELALQLRKIADRLCGLMYKLGVDCNALARFTYVMGDDEERNTFEHCHEQAIKYMRNKMSSAEKKAAQELIE